MLLSQLKAQACAVVDFDAAIWAMAKILGVARNESNLGKKTTDAEWSGPGGVVGALGEFQLMRTVKNLADSQMAMRYMGGGMYDPSGGDHGRGPDLEFIDGESGRVVRVECKTVDCSGSRKHFLINERKHKESYLPNTYYYCCVAPFFSAGGMVAALIEHDEVGGWRLFDRGKHGQPALEIPLADFYRRYGPPGFDHRITPSMQPSAMLGVEEVEAMARNPALHRTLARLIPALGVYLGVPQCSRSTSST